jgi:integrase
VAFTFHDLRHSGLTWAAATRAATAELMHRGGHRDIKAAMRYEHATRDGHGRATVRSSKALHWLPLRVRGITAG